MTSAPPPDRPRPRPRPVDPLQARVDAFFAGADEPEPPSWRRWTHASTLRPLDPAARAALVTRASQAAVAAGVALFVVASLTSPAIGVRASHVKHSPAAADVPAAALDVPSTPAPAAASASVTPAAGRPALAAVRAPADGRAVSALAANGIPKVALNAYRVAAARVAHSTPGCGIDWALLAGIGREESDHGRFRGAVLHTDGISTPAIIGPALDGVHWTYVPAAADYVKVTGDRVFAHALGPMQFIPTTWASFGADADGDRQANVFDINDAALGAARYLCSAGGDLRTHAGQIAAVSAYNQSDRYVAQVLALADAYRRGVPIDGTPVGNTTGALPTVPTGYVPPANPGGPAASSSAGAQPSPSRAAGGAPSSSPAPRSGGTSTRPSGGTSGTGSSAASTASAPPSPSSSGSSAPPSSGHTSSTPPPGSSSTCHLPLGSVCLG